MLRDDVKVNNDDDDDDSDESKKSNNVAEKSKAYAIDRVAQLSLVDGIIDDRSSSDVSKTDVASSSKEKDNK